MRKKNNARKRRTLNLRDQQHTSTLADFQCMGETDAIMDKLRPNISYDQPLDVIDFDCKEESTSSEPNEILDELFDYSLFISILIYRCSIVKNFLLAHCLYTVFIDL